MAELIIDSWHDVGARRVLELLASLGGSAGAVPTSIDLPRDFPRDWFELHGASITLKPAWQPHAAELRDRCARAFDAVRSAPRASASSSLRDVLSFAAALFEAALYFEVHELLEPYWARADGRDRESLQGLIQIAVGFEHWLHGNVAGACALLRDGSTKITGTVLAGLELDEFARATRACGAALEASRAAFEPGRVPRFPEWH